MAYRRKTGTTRYARKPAKRMRRARSSYGAGNKRRTRSYSGRASNIIKLVIEQPAANPVMRPGLGLMPAPTPHVAKF